MGHDDERQPDFLDRVVERIAGLMTAVGLNGSRLLWRWSKRRRALGESGMRGEMLLRSTRAKHKMCRSCRALVDRNAKDCPECGVSLRDVETPGVTRTLTGLFPGISGAASLLMLVNGFWFVLMIMASIKSGADSSPFAGFSGDLLIRFGSGLSRAVQLSTGEIVGGEWWRLVTPIFLHGGLMHFGFNTYLLMQLGPLIENEYGTAKFWVIYLACGLAGSMASQLTRPVNTVGASGAIMGLIGLLIVAGWRRRSLGGQAIRDMLFRLLIYSVVLSLFFNIDHRNHIGGLVCGALLGFFVPPDAGGRTSGRAWTLLAAAGVLLVLFAFYHVAAQGRAGLAAGGF